MMLKQRFTETDRADLQGCARLLATPVVLHPPIRPQLASAVGMHDAAPIELTSTELDAILAGISAGEVALEHARRSGVLKLFLRHARSSSAEPRLEALRAYAELRRVLLADGRRLPSSSLSAAGFTDAQITKSDAIIVERPER